jgi:hypothetical protein
MMFATGGTRMLPAQIRGFSPSTNEVTVDSWTGFALNDMVLLMSSTGCTLRRITAIDKIVNRFQLNPSGVALQNPPAPGLFPSAYGTGDQIANLGNPVVRTYSVANGRLRVVDGPLQAGLAAAPVDLMDGIVDLRAQYGKDNGVNNGTVNAPIYLANDTRVDQFSNTAPANILIPIQAATGTLTALPTSFQRLPSPLGVRTAAARWDTPVSLQTTGSFRSRVRAVNSQ